MAAKIGQSGPSMDAWKGRARALRAPDGRPTALPPVGHVAEHFRTRNTSATAHDGKTETNRHDDRIIRQSRKIVSSNGRVPRHGKQGASRERPCGRRGTRWDPYAANPQNRHRGPQGPSSGLMGAAGGGVGPQCQIFHAYRSGTMMGARPRARHKRPPAPRAARAPGVGATGSERAPEGARRPRASRAPLGQRTAPGGQLRTILRAHSRAERGRNHHAG